MRRRTPVPLTLAMLLPAAAAAQSTVYGPGLRGSDTALEISQIGRGVIGQPQEPFLAEGHGLAIAIRQVGSGRVTGSLRTADALGSRAGTSRVVIEQQGAGGEAVRGAEARLELGLAAAATAQDIALLQRGDHAMATVRIAAGGPVQGLLLGLTQAQAAAAQLDLQAGVGAVIAWTQGAGAQGSLTSAGDGLRATITQAAGSRVDIANTGNNNSYAIATQQPADRLALGVVGHHNSFNLDFQGYREVVWRNAVTQGGSYRVVGGEMMDQNNRVVGAAAVIGR